MASPQLEDGLTGIANEIVEALMMVNLSAYESRVLWFLFRKTYGWKKKTDWITLSQFSTCLKLDRRLIHRAIKALSSKKMIVIERDDGERIRYGFQKDYEKWDVNACKVSHSKKHHNNQDDALNLSSKGMMSSKGMTTVIERDDELSSKGIPTKETITKEKIYSLSHEEIIQKYHETIPELPKVVKWTKTRISHLNVCLQDKGRQTLDWWVDYFKKVKESPFLLGVNDKNWRPDLEWLTTESNLVKVLEGKYNGSKPKTKSIIWT